jgi:low affinity Fe/Cu permease
MTMPSEASKRPGVFDRFADHVAGFTSKAWFFAACVVMVLIWLPSYFLVGSGDTWQLIINTTTTIVTFLLVGLSQNTQKRMDDANQQKLNALIAYMLGETDSGELRVAIGLEEREASEGG